MPWLNAVLSVYAALVVAGGVFGYVKAGSPMSLVMSIAAGILIVIGIAIARKNRSVGYALCAVVAGGLTLFFGFRLIGGNTMPGLPATLMSLVALGACVYAHFNPK